MQINKYLILILHYFLPAIFENLILIFLTLFHLQWLVKDN